MSTPANRRIHPQHPAISPTPDSEPADAINFRAFQPNPHNAAHTASKPRVYVHHTTVSTTPEPKVAITASQSKSLLPPPTTVSELTPIAARRGAKQNSSAPNTGLPTTFMPVKETGVLVDVDALQARQRRSPPTTRSELPYNDAIQRTYGRNSKREVTEDDLVQRIEKLENTTRFQELLERASYKTQLAERKASDIIGMIVLIQGAHEDLLKAAQDAQSYTFGGTWLSQIADARATLEKLANQHQIVLVEPEHKIEPEPKKPQEHPKVKRIVGRIFAALGLLFSASVALHYVIRKYRP